jgi:outer membrane protein OmpA-like peptidoglycan-associated protein
MKRCFTILVLGVFVFVGSFGCSSMSKKEKGALIGGASGAILGGLLGKKAGNTAVGAIAGAAVGGAAGAIIGDYMDKQAEEMENELEGATVERVGEGIAVTFGSGILFDVNKSDLRPAAQEELTKLAEILVEYGDTDLIVEGHTDADGTEEYNQTLSEQRANSVKGYLVGQNVTGARMTTVGHGEMQPIASNETPDGKQANRRVHVIIMANEELKKKAEEQAAQQG